MWRWLGFDLRLTHTVRCCKADGLNFYVTNNSVTRSYLVEAAPVEWANGREWEKRRQRKKEKQVVQGEKQRLWRTERVHKLQVPFTLYIQELYMMPAIYSWNPGWQSQYNWSRKLSNVMVVPRKPCWWVLASFVKQDSWPKETSYDQNSAPGSCSVFLLQKPWNLGSQNKDSFFSPSFKYFKL